MSHDSNLPETMPLPPEDLDLEERKRILAYQLWEEEGRPDGRAEAHWERACLILMSLGEEDQAPPQWLKRTTPEATSVPASEEESVEASEDEAITSIRKRIAARNAA